MLKRCGVARWIWSRRLGSDASASFERSAKLAWSAAGTLHPSLQVRCGPILKQPASEEKLGNFGLSLRDPTGSYACFQTAARLDVVRLVLVSIGHLRSLYGL